ncbi:autotransporter outer membrane beta-barrel domain-containing protein [Salmonella enterica subsp. enterica serovar Gaminara]|nr:autotransporter outer membrane beta-barrel domain-containing protein [Salmonella enterica subsp. enterica serovar Gaminara]
MNIRRQVLENTEAGRGKTDLTGQVVGLQLDYGLAAGNDLWLSPLLGLRFREVQQDGYTESPDITFPVTYDRVARRSTDLLMGLEAVKWPGAGLYLTGGAGAEFSLHREEDTFRGVLAGEELRDDVRRTQDLGLYLQAGAGLQLQDTS